MQVIHFYSKLEFKRWIFYLVLYIKMVEAVETVDVILTAEQAEYINGRHVGPFQHTQTSRFSNHSIYQQHSVFCHVERGKSDTMFICYNMDGNKVMAIIIFTCSTYTSAWGWIRGAILADTLPSIFHASLHFQTSFK